MLVNLILDRVRQEFVEPDIIWEISEISMHDIAFLKEECNTEATFDPLHTRKTTYDKMIHNKAITIIKKCKYGQILAVLDKDQIRQMPWDLWGRILRMYYEGKPFKVFFLADKNLRTFPKIHRKIPYKITPEHINGGYTYRCNTETIVIFRAEDATRVLIHELQHSCCLDNHKNGVDAVEAETEAWAELLYVAILSKGKNNTDMLQKQSEWIIKQNEKVKKYMNGLEFPWRYTVGKEDVWRRWNILQDSTSKMVVNSLRLTYPPDNSLKKRFHVSMDSIIL